MGIFDRLNKRNLIDILRPDIHMNFLKINFHSEEIDRHVMILALMILLIEYNHSVTLRGNIYSRRNAALWDMTQILEVMKNRSNC
jgi:hypothetical protein